jgi:GTP 3',8-cyclase
MTLPLEDRFGRVHRYLRLSVTDRCNYRCVYCLPEDGMDWLPRQELLSFEEMVAVVRVFAGMGVGRVRLTGGEPTARKDIAALVAALAAIPGVVDLSMTTNGHTLAALAPRLRAAGLHRLNVSLDSLRADRFARLTRGGDLHRVLAGIDAALAAGFHPVKINAVLLEGENDDEVQDLVAHFAPLAPHVELRFIEYMPFEARWHRCVPSAQVRARLAERYTLTPADSAAGLGPARTWRIEESGLVVGFISPLSEHFCATCNRLRLMADGHLRTCLAHEDTPSLRDLLRAGADDDALARAIRQMVLGKPVGHDCGTDGGTLFEGVMTGIGG